MSKNYIVFKLFHFFNPSLVEKLTLNELEYIIVMSSVYSLEYRLVSLEVKRRYDLMLKEKNND